MADASVLHQAYAAWYSKGGGRQAEKELLQLFNKLAVDTPTITYTADRFQQVVRKAVEKVEDIEDDSLMNMCKQAITAHGKYHAETFVELQRVIMDDNSSLHKTPSVAAMRAAAERRLTRKDFVEEMAAVLPCAEQCTAAKLGEEDM